MEAHKGGRRGETLKLKHNNYCRHHGSEPTNQQVNQKKKPRGHEITGGEAEKNLFFCDELHCGVPCLASP